MPAWLATTLSVIAGGLLTMVSAWLADRRITERDRERRREERQERLTLRRSEFQRDTLLALQGSTQALLRNTGASLHQDIVAYRTTGIWQKQQLPDELSDDYLRLSTDTMLLASRIRDHEVRILADQLRGQTAIVGLSPGESDAESRMATAAATHQSIVQRIGELIRELDEAN